MPDRNKGESNHVRALRESKRMTQTALATRIGCTAPLISAIEKRRQKASPEMKGMILKALGLPRHRWRQVWPSCEDMPPEVTLPDMPHTPLIPLLDQIPTPGAVWPASDRERWLEEARIVFDQVYEEATELAGFPA